MILDKYAKQPMKINLQLFASKVKNKAEGVSAEDLKALKDDLDKDTGDTEDPEDGQGNDDDPEDDDPNNDDDDEKEDVGEDPDKAGDEDGDDDDDEDSDDDEEDSEEQDTDEDDKGSGKSKGKSKPANKKGSKQDGKDKKTGAIIALKNENKDLRARLDALEKGQREREYDTELDKLVARYTEELIEDGMEEEKAKKRARSMAEDKIESKKAVDRDLDIQVERLEEKGYTDIRSKLTVLRPIVQKSGLTLEEAYRAKYGDIKPREARTRDEQLDLLERKKSSKKAATASGVQKKADTTILSKRDERIFIEMKKKDPTLTRKAYQSLMNDFDE